MMLGLKQKVKLMGLLGRLILGLLMQKTVQNMSFQFLFKEKKGGPRQDWVPF